MKFEAIHKTLNTVSVELVGSAITYNATRVLPVTSLN
jgi:hypothetical protein